MRVFAAASTCEHTSMRECWFVWVDVCVYLCAYVRAFVSKGVCVRLCVFVFCRLSLCWHVCLSCVLVCVSMWSCACVHVGVYDCAGVSVSVFVCLRAVVKGSPDHVLSSDLT